MTTRRTGRRPTRPARRENPATSAPPRRLHNLPTQLTTFIGREREIAEVERLLGTTRLLTLTGSGGCGKTRLVLQVAADLIEQYPDGVWFVDFAPLADPAFVPSSVAASIDVPEQPTRPLTDTLADYVQTKTLLLVLDNCEHLHGACQGLADRLLRSGDTVRILATSREALGVEGEVAYRVPPLRLPDAQQVSPAMHLAEYDAIRLFAERAALNRPGFAVTSSNASAVLHICQRLDGMPLAIELAAARVKVLSVEQIAARLDNRFRLLTGGSRTAIPRQQTLRAAMDWSYNLLSPKERAVLRRLAVFVGGCTLETAEAVCVAKRIAAVEILDLLTRLVDKSLVNAETLGGEIRYRMAETVRQYAQDRLLASGEAPQVRACHRAWYLNLAERADTQIHGPEQTVWLNRLEVEHDNLRAALEWSSTEKRDAEIRLRLTAALGLFWNYHTHWAEGRTWLEMALADTSGLKSPARVKGLFQAGLMAWLHGDYGNAMALSEESLTLAEELGDQHGVALALYGRGLATVQYGDFDGATALFEDSLKLFRKPQDQWWIALTLAWMGVAVGRKGDAVKAVALSEESLAILRALGGTRGIATGLRFTGHAVRLRGDLERAASLYREGLTLFSETGDKWIATDCVAGLALIAAAQGESEQAARLFGASEAARDRYGITFPRPMAGDQEPFWAAIRERPDRTPFAAAWAEGRAMTLDQAIGYALQPTRKKFIKSASRRRAGLLAPRERQVAALIAEGKTNKEIAAILSVTQGTAATHVNHILNKLGANSRSQIAAWAVTHGLLPSSPLASVAPIDGH